VTADLLELVDYLSLGALVAATPLVAPRPRGWLRRLAWLPLIAAGAWTALVALLVLMSPALGESYAWIVYACLVSIVFALIEAAAYLTWAALALACSPVTRRVAVLSLGVTIGAVCVAVGLQWCGGRPGTLALAMSVYALVGVAAWFLLRHWLRGKETDK
jgi:hypothetical protein